MKHILIISKNSPYTGQSLRESLDTVLIFAAIDQKVTWLLEGDAVFALAPAQDPKSLQHKDFTKAIKMLEIYDVDDVYVCTKSIAARGLNQSSLTIDTLGADSAQKQALLSQADHVVVL
ncbi:sulfurtransferase complex subunit TusC [Pseudoalteromonas sp. YIC-656]|uniref:sulfurtransferase complex subunit TusC n=1 Tax=Pseudoalteromonas pernae TaxID=3118054 RepID=UPI003241E3B2